MGQSIRASEQGLAIANQARQRRGWTKTSTARWWQDAHTSRATLRRFWRGERIQQGAFIAICQVVGLDDWQTIAEPTLAEPTVETLPAPTLVDWGDAPDVEQFFGRQQELEQLSSWVIQDQAKLISISGLGGSGKTALVLALAEQLQPEFTGIIWRDAAHIPSPEALVDSLLDTAVESADQGIKQLHNKLQIERWLILLDNVDAKGHLQVIHWLTRVRHQSCFVVMGHQPLPPMFQGMSRFYSLSLSGLSREASIQLLHDCGCSGPPYQLGALARVYSDNPLALKLISTTIRTVFGGQIASFLQQGTEVLPDPIRLPLQKQFQSLDELEREVIFWLAIWQEPISLCRLQTHLLNANPADVIAALSQLLDSAIITQHFLTEEPSFSLQPMVMTFAINELVAKVIRELLAAQQATVPEFQILRTHCSTAVSSVSCRRCNLPRNTDNTRS
ncbi:MAG: NB-ARC domain-containing protein, partial [Cyanobacteria bacterium J06642_11]